ncbi:hypothetical protein TSUD_182080 [Trifolium subterraneum]|uniref:Reverse transcriptase domain-containing protein n=1 Tax=Trifolium subterraneum TaxID=3900 RepID=A0A2Z6PDL5_TRISU|nr:hypothetical protein TSUD_182080 [Trifolium subterraneum]
MLKKFIFSLRQKEFNTIVAMWIRECVSTATTSVLVNGSHTDEFPLGRGFRQGDPLSPFLFLLAAEGLNVMMWALVQSHLFTGYSIRIASHAVVSHLQFADDTLLLGIRSWANVRALRAVLVLFEAVSGLKVNFNKSMLVGVNIADSWLAEAVKPVVNRIRSRLVGWKSHFLSFGGRLVLLKSVLTSLAGREDRTRSAWWREIVRIRDEEGDAGERGWFAASIEPQVGNGVDTLFWTDQWLGGAPLSVKYRHLFDLSLNKLMMVEEMRELGGLLSNVVLQPSVAYIWLWRHDPGGGYTVQGAYILLTRTYIVVEDVPTDLIWHKQVPIKVFVLAWRLVRNRLPTKDNLMIQHIITLDSQSLGWYILRRSAFNTGPLHSVFPFLRRHASSALFSAAPLVMQHLSGVARAK